MWGIDYRFEDAKIFNEPPLKKHRSEASRPRCFESVIKIEEGHGLACITRDYFSDKMHGILVCDKLCRKVGDSLVSSVSAYGDTSR